MNDRKVIALRYKVFIIVLLLALGGCAGFGIFSSAKYEFDKGLGLFNRGMYEEAIPHFERATEISPDFARAHLYLGRSYLNLGKWRQAIAPLRTALRLSPDEVKKEVADLLLDALLGGAISDFKEGQFDASITRLREAWELQPQSPRARNEVTKGLLSLGAALISQGRLSEAIEAYGEAVELFPDNLSAYLGLAKALISKGEFQRAVRALLGALSIDPGSTEARALLKELLGR